MSFFFTEHVPPRSSVRTDPLNCLRLRKSEARAQDNFWQQFFSIAEGFQLQSVTSAKQSAPWATLTDSFQRVITNGTVYSRKQERMTSYARPPRALAHPQSVLGHKPCHDSKVQRTRFTKFWNCVE